MVAGRYDLARPDDLSMIYVMLGASGAVKVGLSRDLYGRLRMVEFERRERHSLASYLMVSRSSVRAIEALAHHLLSADALGNERFAVSPDAALSAVFEAARLYEIGRTAPRAADDPDEAMVTLRVMVPKRVERAITEWRAKQPGVPGISASLRRLIVTGLEVEAAAQSRATR